MTSKYSRSMAFAAVAAAGLPGCSEIVNPNCPDSGGAGWGYAVVLTITDPAGRPATLGTTVRLIGSGVDEAITGTSPDEPSIAIGDEPGRYTVVITRPWWISEALEVRVRRSRGPCPRLVPVTRDVALELRPDAPPVRQVVAESDHIQVTSNPPFTVSGGSGETQLRAFVEADPGVSTEVDWRSLDPEIAAVTLDGVMTVKCRESPIDTQIVASARADPGVFTIIRVTVLRTQLWQCPASST